ncbi:MAG: alpha/beta fold hydrolase [bacterium]
MNTSPEWLSDIKSEYPFTPKRLKLNNGFEMSYVDEGQGPVILMLHGNPTWSFYYRNLIKHFAPNYRVIVPDHLGMGLSERPQQFEYQLHQHVAHVEELLDSLKIEKFSLIVHDWGGAIGFGVATLRPNAVEKAVILNTAAFNAGPWIPKRISMCRAPVIGEPLVRGLNGFAFPATFMTTVKPLPKNIRRAYLAPYNDWNSRIAVSRFVQDIPLSKSHPSFETLAAIEAALPALEFPKMIIWGEKDFCFDMRFFNKWKTIYPDSESMVLDAGHYVLEDMPSQCAEAIEGFLAP